MRGFAGTHDQDVAYWHETDLPRCPQFGRYRGESGRSRVSSAMQLVVVSFPPKLHVLRSLANTAH
jgi:hypothetical protein